MSIARRLGALALAVAGTAVVNAPAQAQWAGGVLTASTSSMLFEFVSREASFTHHLGLFSYDGSNTVFYQNIFSSPPDMPGASTTVSLEIGKQYVLGLYSPSAQSCFIFCVNMPTTFFSNGTATPSEIFGSSNFAFDFGGSGLIGIEDKRDGWFGNADNDFDDMVIRASPLTVTPEPGTVALLGTGIAALAGFGVARRRRGSSLS
ncbi:MAG TPA: PEP-CTERM sorting domain-containing protein [Gemmatimonadales bacterium]